MLYKQCRCDSKSTCRHFWHFEFECFTRRFRASTKTTNRRVAERIELKARTAAIDQRYDLEMPKAQRLSVHVTRYLEHTAAVNVTSYKDEGVLTRLKTLVGDKWLTEIKSFDIERYKTARIKDVAKSTVNRELNIVRGCFARAVEWGVIPASPAIPVKDFDVDDCRVRVLTDDELRRVMAIDDPFVVDVCRTTLESLARLSEVLGIHRTHIGAGWAEVRRKGGAVQRVDITPELRSRLLARCHETSDMVFGEGALGGVPTQQTATNRVLRALATAGVPDASHHTMRHTGVTLMLEDGVNPRVIQRLAGWSSLRMLERYGHPRDAEAQRAVRGVASRLDGLGTEVAAAETQR